VIWSVLVSFAFSAGIVMVNLPVQGIHSPSRPSVVTSRPAGRMRGHAP
jgi:hypothetical protein